MMELAFQEAVYGKGVVCRMTGGTWDRRWDSRWESAGGGEPLSGVDSIVCF